MLRSTTAPRATQQKEENGMAEHNPTQLTRLVTSGLGEVLSLLGTPERTAGGRDIRLFKD